MRAKLLKNGAPGKTRTPNPLLRRQMLYPVELRAHLDVSTVLNKHDQMVGEEGLEPPTKAL